MTMDKVVLIQIWNQRWIIQLQSNPSLAWSGSRWVEHDKGIGFVTQICNFATIVEAAQYAKRSGFEVCEIQQEL